MLESKRDAKFPRASGLRTTEGSTLLRTGRGRLGADQVCVQSVVQCVEDRGWRLPPVPLPGADADLFAQREHLSLSWIQPVHTYCSRDALHRFEIRARRSCACLAHSSSLHHRFNCCSAAATGQVAPNNPCELYSTDILEYSNTISPSHSSGCSRIFLGHHRIDKKC